MEITDENIFMVYYIMWCVCWIQWVNDVW